MLNAECHEVNGGVLSGSKREVGMMLEVVITYKNRYNVHLRISLISGNVQILHREWTNGPVPTRLKPENLEYEISVKYGKHTPPCHAAALPASVSSCVVAATDQVLATMKFALCRAKI